MNLDGLKEQAQWSSMLYHDNKALTNIKHSSDQQGALEQVAGQFEAMFLQLVLRQMRSSSDALADEDSPFSSQQYGVFRDMYDGQLAIEMAKKQHAGIADMLVKQLGPSVSPFAAFPANSEPLTPAKTDSVNTAVLREFIAPAANDASCVIKAESRSQSHIAPGFNGCNLVNNPDLEVASMNKQQVEVAVSTAFAQPLIRTLEP
ncbi:rod-binding protein [Enterovibrio nigricans]|uniref:Flagellar protein FlgJ n=1 Tax=Enterovibrio nigricans DSM 22720 TaxID=1121868 RepID=A0A1T4UK48_9GAMM|nr:rod-binding protein [Enterovibrio nigricans]PKF51196.1 flagellar protein [Enterovibrio nigricans]SKA53105.1 flagellar protein FlgJ [Enterovibrio nigricans DSM 22720]